jgi:hypothetical protein
MIGFSKKSNKIIFSYTPERDAEENWALEKLEQDGDLPLKRTFYFLTEDIYSTNEPEVKPDSDEFDLDFGTPTAHFIFARLKGQYYKVKRGILLNDFDIYIHTSVELDKKLFLVDSDISVFKIIASLVNRNIYIGGDHEGAIPEKAFRLLIDNFPNTYEKRKYVEARVASVLRNYLDHVTDAEAKYHKYMNKKITSQGADLRKMFKKSELYKYQTILEKLKDMLDNEDVYSEKQWQQEIIQIILLIYPKYIAVFREVPVRVKNTNERSLDYMLVDSSGYTDIVEIKRPFGKAIITENEYRKNYIPLRELTGTIMQIEKYIYYLNRWGIEGEKKLTEKYSADLPKGLTIKITNPGGIIIMGRDHKLTEHQKADFEVVKRKYKNVVDIITYDNLLQRLKSTIEQIKKT